MKSSTNERRKRWWRALWLAAMSVGGLVTLVGSGGGAIGFPPCNEPWCNQPPPTDPPSVTVQPAYVTAQVGTAVRFDALPSGFGAATQLQWSRSGDGGLQYVDIPGATGTQLVLPAVNLSDDGARLRARATAANGISAVGIGHLTVVATPGLVLSDGDFTVADWQALPQTAPDGSLPVHVERRELSGGNPGAWLRIEMRIPAGTGGASMVLLHRDAVYTPATQGALAVIDHAEDCRSLAGSELQSVESQPAFEQAGRLYVAPIIGRCPAPTWGAEPSRASLRAGDFVPIVGPPCTAGESCPDFGPAGAPMRWGVRRVVFGMPGDLIAHGLDNWRVTLWRR